MSHGRSVSSWLALRCLSGLFVLAACSASPAAPLTRATNAPLSPAITATPTAVPFVPLPASEQAAQLGRGINFGDALDAPNEGEWGWVLQESYFDVAQQAGFRTIRLPVRWSA